MHHLLAVRSFQAISRNESKLEKSLFFDKHYLSRLWSSWVYQDDKGLVLIYETQTYPRLHDKLHSRCGHDTQKLHHLWGKGVGGQGNQLTPLCGLGQHGRVVSGTVARGQCPWFCLHLLYTPGPADSVQTSWRVFWEAGLSPHAVPFLHCLDCSFPCWFKRQQAYSHFPSFRSWLKFCTG